MKRQEGRNAGTGSRRESETLQECTGQPAFDLLFTKESAPADQAGKPVHNSADYSFRQSGRETGLFFPF